MLCGLVKLTANLVNVDSETVTAKRSEPAATIEPSVAAIVALSALYNTKLAVATPLLKLMFVAEPTFVPATVGAVTGEEELDAPEKVKLLVPVYPVAVLPLASFAVMVIVCAAPAVPVPLPVMINLVAALLEIVIDELVPVAPPVVANAVNVPAPDAPV
ncbi:hypothetical protein AQEC111735_11980 [Aquirufa ecclesiirivi]